jgi:hypothetical protein
MYDLGANIDYIIYYMYVANDFEQKEVNVCLSEWCILGPTSIW